MDLRTRRAWVDLPDGWSWEPVEATTLPTPEFYHRADPQNIVRYRTADELRTALLAEGWTPGDKMSFFEAALCGLLNDGVPASGEIIWEERPDLLITEPPPRPRPGRNAGRINGLSPEQLAEFRRGRGGDDAA